MFFLFFFFFLTSKYCPFENVERGIKISNKDKSGETGPRHVQPLEIVTNYSINITWSLDWIVKKLCWIFFQSQTEDFEQTLHLSSMHPSLLAVTIYLPSFYYIPWALLYRACNAVVVFLHNFQIFMKFIVSHTLSPVISASILYLHV